MNRSHLLHGDNMHHLAKCPDGYFDSCVVDPPYGLKFMNKHWDHTVPSVETWREVLRVLKPGAHLLSFFGTRTYHRGVTAIEDAGFEIRDQIGWLYGSGFPKSLNVSKAIDRAAGAKRDRVPRKTDAHSAFHVKHGLRQHQRSLDRAADGTLTGPSNIPATEAAKQWDGWGTALKPAWEPIVVARKPLIGTVASNVLEHGTGGLNIDGCRVWHNEPEKRTNRTAGEFAGTAYAKDEYSVNMDGGTLASPSPLGRWPANVIHDGSDEVLAEFAKYGESGGGYGVRGKGGDKYAGGKGFANTLGETGQVVGFGDTGTAARFFYCAKASKKERNAGLENMEQKSAGECTDRKDGSAGLSSPRAGAGRTSGSKNHHPTVKPIALMEYLVKLVTPSGGIVLDPYAGSGSTLIACKKLGFDYVGIELEKDFFDIAEQRLASWGKEI